MTRVLGPSRDQLDALGDDYAGLVAVSLAEVARDVGNNLSVEDLVTLRAWWADEVDQRLLPALGVGFEVGATTIRVALREAVGLTASGATVDAGPARDLPARRDGQDGGRIVSPGDVRNRLPSPGQPLTAAAFTDLAPTADALAEAYLAQARNRLVGVGDELWGHAREELLEGLRAGEGVGELAARVRRVAPDLTEPRAEQLARTEMLGACNAGALAQVRASGASGTKTWLATDDQRTRHSHDLADDDTVPLAAHFTVGGFPMDRPHDPAGPPQEVISCRCALGFDLDLDNGGPAGLPTGPPAGEAPTVLHEDDDSAGVRQRQDRSFLERVFAKGLAFMARLFRVQTAAAMLSEREFEPEGGMVTADAARPVEHFHYHMAEGVSTGMRTFAAGAITWREPPFAFMWQKMVPETGGHGLAVQAGLITRAERSGQLVDFYGPLDLNSDDGLEYARRLVEGFARWGSVSPDENKVDVEVVWAEGTSEEDMLLGGEPEQFVFHSFNVAELTALSVPALADATIEPTPALIEELRARGLLTGQEATAVAASAVHTITIPDIPPAWWFEEPIEKPMFGAVEITDEGRLFGLLAPANVGHRGFSERVTAPVGSTDYREFHEPRDFGRFMNPPVLVERDGEVDRIKAGCLTLAGGHATTRGNLDWLDTVKHYDESESVVARVRIGENEQGVWVAGYVLPDVTPAQLQRMMACQLSGDWRPHKEKPGWYDFAAALFVPVPGFPMAASGVEVPHGAVLRFQEDRLVASAVPVRHAACACPTVTASAAPDGVDLGPTLERIASSMGRDRASRQRELAARVRAGRS